MIDIVPQEKNIFCEFNTELKLTAQNGTITYYNSGNWAGKREKINDNTYLSYSLDNKLMNTEKCFNEKKLHKLAKDIELSTKNNLIINYHYKRKYSLFNDSIIQNDALHIFEYIKQYGNEQIKMLKFFKGSEIDLEQICKLEDKIDKVIVDKKNSILLNKSLNSIVLDSESAGLITSMVVGYLFEGDRISSSTSYLFNHKKRFIVNPLLTISDTLDESLPIYYEYDEEGVKAKKNVILLDHGVSKDFITDRLSAKLLGVNNTGRCRSEDYRFTPFPRIGNIVTKNGTNTLSETFKEVNNAVYYTGISGAAVDVASGVIHANFYVGYLIENGEITCPIGNVSLSINIFDFIKNIKIIGNDDFTSFRIMGKSRPLQNNYIGFRSPHLALEGYYAE